MKTVSLLTIALVFLTGASIGIAQETVEELDAPMQVFDSMARVPGALYDMPGPEIGDGELIYEMETPEVTEESLEAAEKAARDEAYRQEIAAAVREGFASDAAFERGGQFDPRLGHREDAFHTEEGEDVDLEDSFNDDPDDDPEL